MIICINSLATNQICASTFYDYVFVDEMDSLVSALLDNKLISNLNEVISQLIRHFNKATKVFMMDANMSNSTLTFLSLRKDLINFDLDQNVAFMRCLAFRIPRLVRFDDQLTRVLLRL